MKFVKGDKTIKSEWSKLRRQIVPKIGQLTNDAQAISQIVCLLRLSERKRSDTSLDTADSWNRPASGRSTAS
jgi:hypothetical protein